MKNDYLVLISETIAGLATDVRKAMEDGWIPTGGIFVDRFSQKSGADEVSQKSI